MPTFTLKLSPDGAVVRAVITPSSDDEGKRRNVSIQGVLDSGADFTVIDNSVVRQLGLEPVGKQLIHVGWYRHKTGLGGYLSSERPNLCD